MSDREAKPRRKKSFLRKVAKVFKRKKKRVSSESAESHDDDNACAVNQSVQDLETSRAVNSSSSTIKNQLEIGKNSLQQGCIKNDLKSRDAASSSTLNREHQDLLLLLKKDSPTNSFPVNQNIKGKQKLSEPDLSKTGTDRYYEAKNIFLSQNANLSLQILPDEEATAGDNKMLSTKNLVGSSNDSDSDSERKWHEKLFPGYKRTKRKTKKFLSKENNISGNTDTSDSDETDDSTSSSSSRTSSSSSSSSYCNKALLESEGGARNIREDYFTKGKYITFFFLQMERQSYDPSEIYTMIRYRTDGGACGDEGENSSSGSTSPNIPILLRRKLLHRRSADNLIINSMRHSSPESIKSAPIELKPRSTSHDALSKKKDSHQPDGVSMDSLAKQALLAAQVLNLIPTNKARERNFLHGRIAANSLLGSGELEKVLPNREIKIFVGTWNMNGQTPPKELNDFMLPSDIETVPDMLAIGTQESCSERSEWEAALQETLGPSHVLLSSTSLGTLHLALFLRRDLIWFCSVAEEGSFSTRPGTAFRTKGAVALALMLFGTSFLFVTAHLTAHQDKVKERIHDIKKIIRNLDLPKDLPTRHKSKDVTQNFDCVFWCGDLNFRLAQPREDVIQWISDTRFPQESPINMQNDQLRTLLNEGAVLRGFEEAPITFPPTYKYDPGTQNFDSSSKQRTPAYTDRILFKGKGHTRGYIRRVSYESTNSHRDGAIECLVYDSVPSICTSDHKPVWGVFKTTIRPGIDTIPLGAGLFNREVYLEGIKRRAAAMDDSQGSSRVCTIQ